MPTDFGKCAKEFGNPAMIKDVCENYEERDDEKVMLLRQQNMIEMLSGYFNQINDLLLILLSDKEEYSKKK